MGTRLWYALWDAEKDDDRAFESRLEPVVREIGERGKLVVPSSAMTSQGPSPEPSHASAQTSAPAAAAAAAPAPPQATVPALPTTSFIPSMQQAPAATRVEAMQPSQSLEGMAGTFAELAVFFRDERTHLEAKLERQLEEMKLQRREFEVKAEQQRQEIEKLRAMLAARPQLAIEAIDEAQLFDLQLRLQSMAEASLLTDKELEDAEDAIVDCIEMMPVAGVTVPVVQKVTSMLLLASKVASDSVLARQLRRKFKVGGSR